MRLRVIEYNHLSYPNWTFKLLSETQEEYYIMNNGFYKQYNLKSPISYRELDSLDKGCWINAVTERINDTNVVTSLRW
ncbi:MAG: hypothetical protein K0Q79_311 [Flavipsychrobacter sp.]|jgi:translation elongation factor P/translation initiation factor 5A|nr:hypothetical protein [Flavipsychrobacter sp.]